MRGVGLQHMQGVGFLLGRVMGEDGLPVWSGPSYIQISSARAGVGAGKSMPLLKKQFIQQMKSMSVPE